MRQVKTVFRIGKALLLILGVYIFIVTLFSIRINKEKPVLNNDFVKQNRVEIYKTLNNPEFNKTKAGKIVLNLYRFSNCMVMGEACTNRPEDADRNFDKSLIGMGTHALLFPFVNPPASGIAWMSDGMKQVGIIPKAFASEGIGFGSIHPFVNIWIALRDVAYLVLVLVIVTIGFMIMFRTKINPQTVISLENALPKIVMALIYITFSFAIAGFMIDLMYVAIAIIISIIGSADPTMSPQIPQIQNMYIGAGPLQIFSGLYAKTSGGLLGGWIQNPFNILFELPNALLNLVAPIGAILRIIGSLLGIFWLYPWFINLPMNQAWLNKIDLDVGASLVGTADFKGLLGFFTQSLGGFLIFVIIMMLSGAILVPLLLGLVIFLTVIMLFFRILLMLFSSYMKILLLVILSPIYLMLEAVPGQSTFSSWIKGLAGELIAFPATIAIFCFSIVIVNSASTGNLIQLPFLVGMDPGAFTKIIGMWFLFMTPDLVALVQKQLNPKPLPLDAGIGTFFGGASAGIGAGMGELSKYALLAQSFSPLRKVFSMIPGFGDTYKKKA